MKNFLYVLSERTNAVIRVIAMTCVIVMLGTMLLQIFARYGFNAPPVWTEEVARYMMVWSGLLGATMSFKSRTDAVLVDSMWPNSLRLIGNLLQFFAVLCFLLPVLYFCFFNWQGVWGQGYLGRPRIRWAFQWYGYLSPSRLLRSLFCFMRSLDGVSRGEARVSIIRIDARQTQAYVLLTHGVRVACARCARGRKLQRCWRLLLARSVQGP